MSLAKNREDPYNIDEKRNPDRPMDGSFYTAAGSLVVSILALVLSFVAIKRSGKLADFEFATRLVIENEQVVTSTPSFPDALRYSADIVNSGLKPADILSGWVSYGSKDGAKRVRHNVLGETAIAPGKIRQVQFSMSWGDLRKVMTEHDIGQVHFELILEYRNHHGEVVTRTRNIVTLANDLTVGYAHRGDKL